jgi:hypothetical protein
MKHPPFKLFPLIAAASLAFIACGGPLHSEEGTVKSPLVGSSSVPATRLPLTVCANPVLQKDPSQWTRNNPDGPTFAHGPYSFAVSYGNKNGLDWARYSCKEPCSEQNPLDCAYSLADEPGRKRLSVVVDGLGAEIRFTAGGPERKTIIVASGGPSTDRLPASVLGILQGWNMRVLDVAYETGLVTAQTGQQCVNRSKDQDGNVCGPGWFTSPDGNPSDMIARTARYAAIVSWAKDTFAPSKRFGVIGCSASGVQGVSAIFWHGLDPKIDYIFTSGGPWIHDISCYCSGGPLCPKGISPALEVSAGLRLGFDYVYGLQDTCTKGKGHSRFRKGSYRYCGRAGNPSCDSQWNAVADFQYTVGKSWIPNLYTDEEGGFSQQAEAFYRMINATKKTRQVFFRPHCLDLASRATCMKICDGMQHMDCDSKCSLSKTGGSLFDEDQDAFISSAEYFSSDL